MEKLVQHSEKEQYTTAREAQLAHLREVLTRLEERASQAAGDAKVEMHRVAEEFRSRDVITRVRLSELKDSTSEAWEEVKFGFESAWAELEHSAKLARSHFHS
ncbi:MAG: hypothetical protein Q8P18_29485 [Pseudomonadota bacterium]|nr:hypothetical protein [Pseudomonadota bacterium]